MYQAIKREDRIAGIARSVSNAFALKQDWMNTRIMSHTYTYMHAYTDILTHTHTHHTHTHTYIHTYKHARVQALVTAAYAAVAAAAFAFAWSVNYNLAAALLVNWARDRLSLTKVASLLALAWFGKVCRAWN